MPEKVLLIDDEVQTCNLYGLMLTRLGFQIAVAYSGAEGLKKAYHFQPQVILLDIMMPEMNGWEACKRLRELCDVPIIMLTALSTQDAIIKGLDLGADDYLVKPITEKELEARIRTVIRRSSKSAVTSENQGNVIRQHGLVINIDKHEVLSNGSRINLSPTEFRILAVLAQNKGHVVSRDFLLTKVWGQEFKNENVYLHTYMSYLRNKLEKDPSSPILIQTIRNVGYRFG